MAVSAAEMQSLVGHSFPGGAYTLAHWENVLLCETMCTELPPDGLAHPMFLTYAAIAGLGIEVADMLELLQVDPELGVQNGETRLEIRRPLREETRYRMSGDITSIVRKESAKLGQMDVATVRIEIREDAADELDALLTMTLLIMRGD